MEAGFSRHQPVFLVTVPTASCLYLELEIGSFLACITYPVPPVHHLLGHTVVWMEYQSLSCCLPTWNSTDADTHTFLECFKVQKRMHFKPSCLYDG